MRHFDFQRHFCSSDDSRASRFPLAYGSVSVFGSSTTLRTAEVFVAVFLLLLRRLNGWFPLLRWCVIGLLSALAKSSDLNSRFSCVVVFVVVVCCCYCCCIFLCWKIEVKAGCCCCQFMCSFRYVSSSHKSRDQGRDAVQNCYTPGRSACGSTLAISGRTSRCSLTSNHLFKALFLLLFFFVVVVFFFDSSPPHTLKLLALLVTPISSVICSFHRANFRIASILMPSNRPTLLQLIEFIFCYLSC